MNNSAAAAAIGVMANADAMHRHLMRTGRKLYGPSLKQLTGVASGWRVMRCTMTELSTAAQTVLNAYRADWRDEQLRQDVKCLAAALRAAADRVVPYDARMTFDLCSHELERVRGEFLAIATELESAQ